MAADDRVEIPIFIPDLPGKPEAKGIITRALNDVIDACDDDIAAASILFTVGLTMAQSLGKTPEMIRGLVDRELERVLKGKR